ncbi:apoptosis-stimulating of p53 protein 2-like isoform X2 [Macrobrachium nipponense]|uniref:apoptosis-stimulating of p53 protein 2-like isoform X2 n=1 Tax=Macrobrachium nipponense TaxID=159736 RepID=UPI0030C84FFA
MLPEILGVVGEDGTVSWVPLTPITTFRDVAACVRDTGDPLPLLLETSPLGVRVVAGWERPLELLRLWSELKDQVIYSVSYRHKDDPADLLASFSRSYSLEEEEDEDEDKEPINPWELYDLKDELKNLNNHRPLRASSPVEGDRAPSGSRTTTASSSAKPLSRSLDDSDELMAVSSDGEADSSYNSHTQRSRVPFREANWFPHFNRSFRRPAGGGSSRNPPGRMHFARGQSQTSSLPSKSQKVVTTSTAGYPKEHHPSFLESHPFYNQHRKRDMQSTTENGGSQFQRTPKHKLHEHLIDYENYLQHLHRNRNLSPVISKKQKLRHTEYKNVSTKPHDSAGFPNGTGARPSCTNSHQSDRTQWNQRNIRHLLQEHFSSKIQNRIQPSSKDVRNGEQKVERSAKDVHNGELKWERSPQYGSHHTQHATRPTGGKENHLLHRHPNSNGFSHDKSFFGYVPGDQRQSQPPEYPGGHKRHHGARVTDTNGSTDVSTPFDKSFYQHSGMPKTNGSLTYHQMNGHGGTRHYSSPLSKYLSPFANGKAPKASIISLPSEGRAHNSRSRFPRELRPQHPEEGHPLPHKKGRGSPPSRDASKPRGGVDRPSRKSSAASASKQEVVHRRSYSDPLYEYLKEDFRALDYRKPTRRRRHSGGSGLGGDVVMRDTRAPLTLLPDGCELTVGELRDMASRQQQQIETQQQLLVAREQRLKYLKQQESRAAAVAAEADRLRRLRERVEAQEAKLRRLRALRGQVEATRLNTASLTTDLDAMRHLFSEKEKELVLAVSKVEELTRQLEELRQGRSPLNPNNQHHNELDKLRRELLYRNSVNREASARVDAQRETLAARRDEITRIDKRIAELQQRLHRKRILNHQLASQITAATQAKQAQLKAVQQKALRDGIHSENSADDINTPDHLKVPPSEDLGEFGPNKNDPKYQTLPYNTKFSVTFKTKNGQGGGESDSAPTTPTGIAPVIAMPDATTSVTTAPIITSTTVPVSSAVVTRTVHSIPTHPPSRGHAHAPGALNQSQPLQISQQPSGPVKPPPNPAMTPRVYGPVAQQFNQRTQPLGSSTGPNQKLNPGLTSLAQTRSLLPVHQSQEAENVKGIGINTVGEGSEDIALGAENGRVKPALPPKPAVPSKPLPPPRQKGDHLAASNESLNSAVPANRVGSQGRSQHGFRYASQNVIMSTYTQQTGTDPQSAEGSDDGAINKVANNIHNSVSNSKTESDTGEKIHVSINRRIEMPPDFMFPEDETPPSDLLGQKVEEIENGTSDTQAIQQENGMDTIDHIAMQPSLPVTELEKLRINHSKEDKMSQEESTLANNGVHIPKDDSRKPDGADTNSVTIEEGRPENEGDHSNLSTSDIINNINDNINNNNSNNGGVIVRRIKKGNLKTKNSSRVPRRVSFDPLALLLDASLEGELELVRRTAMEVPNPSAANDEGITALHNAICAGHLDIVTFLVTFGCDVNAQDSDGWTPLHCAASCNNVAMVRFLVEHGACILATTLSDHETAAEKCEQDEEGYDGCSQYLYSVQEKLGIMNGGVVYGVYDYDSQASDELSFRCGDAITILRRGDEYEREWWWGQLQDIQGYVPRNLLGLYPRVKNPLRDS